jgi:hypothetical protein
MHKNVSSITESFVFQRCLPTVVVIGTVAFLLIKYMIIEKEVIVSEIAIKFHPNAKAIIIDRKQLTHIPITHAKVTPQRLTI